MKAEIEKRQYVRFTVLDALYNQCKGSTTQRFNLAEIASNVGIKNGAFDEVAGYLSDEKLIVAFINPGKYHCTITHKGKKVIEFAHRFPEQSSEYFPALNEMQ
jgi:predicted transcriptional regulator